MKMKMRPEDLRAIVAAIYDASPNAIHQPKVGIEKADHLLNLLAKTAKPEAAPAIEEHVEGRTVTVYPCPRCGETDPTSVDWWRGVVQEMEQQASKLRNKFAAATAQLETAEARVKELEAEVQRIRAAPWGVWTRAQLSAEVDRLNTALQTARADAAREERERIIKLLLDTKLTDVYSLCDKYHGSGWVEGALIALLEPKP